jgi:hypothetical protein
MTTGLPRALGFRRALAHVVSSLKRSSGLPSLVRLPTIHHGVPFTMGSTGLPCLAPQPAPIRTPLVCFKQLFPVTLNGYRAFLALPLTGAPVHGVSWRIGSVRFMFWGVHVCRLGTRGTGGCHGSRLSWV